MKEEKTYRQEAVVPDRGLPFKLFRFEGADGKYIREAHQHCSVEIFAVREGKADVYLGDKKYVLSAGEFMIINSNEVHSIHTSGRNEAIVLQIPMEKQIMRFSGEKREEDEKLFALLEKMYRQSKEGLERTATAQQREITQKCRLAVGLGAMSGMFLVLLLL